MAQAATAPAESKAKPKGSTGRSVDSASPERALPGNAERTLRILLIVSIVLPVLMFVGVSWIAYYRQFEFARDQLLRTLGTAHEHAVKVFETFELSARYVGEIMYQVSDKEIRANERQFNARLRVLTDFLPQLRDVWIIDAQGRPIVSGTVFPIPRDLDLSDRDYFRVHRAGVIKSLYVGEVLQARAARSSFFALSQRRTGDDGVEFRGVMVISAAPEYFTKYYDALAKEERAVFALVRADGAVLARHPVMADAGQGARLPADALLFKAIADAPQSGIYTGTIGDGAERVVAYRRLPRHNVYVVAGIAKSTIVGDWAQLIAGHLLFGIPATAAMVALAWSALRRARRETLAHAQLREETARRLSTESALLQAQKMEAVGRLTGGIAHDFNNLLTAILGNVDLVLRRLREPEERIRRSLGNARDATKRAATLVQRLLTFSRQHPQEVQIVDVNRLVRDMSELLQRTIGEPTAIETVLAAGLWKASLDPNQLENAILNLAVNARDAMPLGGKLTIETANTHIDDAYVAAHGPDCCSGQCVMVAVSDTGAGMSPEVIEQAFEPFYTTKPQGIGTGLGLSMVYGFVKQSNGHVKIYSELGHGTAVKMYFPRVIDPAAGAEWAAGRASGAPAIAPSGSGETILVVEDDETVRRFSMEVLTDAGYRVLAAADGEGALELLARNPETVLLFTDVVLPGGMNGRALANTAEKRRAGIRVLFTTGYTRNAIVHHGRLDPGVEVLIKPFTYDALASKVRTMLDAARKDGGTQS